MRILITGFILLLVAQGADATSVDAISRNVNGMRQLSPANIVTQYPGAAPYYGPAMCEQELPVMEATVTAFDPAYTCSCATPQSAPSCSGPAHQPPAASCPSTVATPAQCLMYVGGGQGVNGYIGVPCSGNNICSAAAWVTGGAGASLYCQADEVGTEISSGSYQCEFNGTTGAGMTPSSTCGGGSAPPVSGSSPLILAWGGMTFHPCVYGTPVPQTPICAPGTAFNAAVNMCVN